ncbi:MAG: 50S ribosomal protein L2 [Planctomycetes bacterium]|nr:50S ribosomal protein L2 [Planctomycetota bacterium]
MTIKYYKPTSPGRRQGSVILHSEELTRTRPEKSLLRKLPKTGGRNAHGHITSWQRGGRARRQYRLIDFKRDKEGVPARVHSIEYDPNRTCYIALLHYRDGEKRYILAPRGVKPGMLLMSGPGAEPRDGNANRLRDIPVGLVVHNVELSPGRGGQLGRSAGSAINYMAREGEYAILTLPSGEVRKVHLNCRATIGALSNPEHNLVKLGKAGRSRWKGRRPHVRGTAMNPVSHPMGGGEGRTKGGRHPCSAWGKLSKGGKTRNPRKTSSKYILRRKKKRK